MSEKMKARIEEFRSEIDSLRRKSHFGAKNKRESDIRMSEIKSELSDMERESAYILYRSEMNCNGDCCRMSFARGWAKVDTQSIADMSHACMTARTLREKYDAIVAELFG